MNDTDQLKLTLSPVVESLHQGLGPGLLSVVLFGSRARGESSPESDWDLLVIARDLPERALVRHFFLKKMLPDAWRGQTSLLAKTPQEFESRLPSLYLDIALDGVVLFDPQGYIAPRLEWIRQQIERYHLQRRLIGHDLVWSAPFSTWSSMREGFA